MKNDNQLVFKVYYTFYKFQAGIPTHSLTIALEPECASVYCQYLTAEHWKTDERNFSFSNIGRKYMIVDLGGKYF